jgi:serine/threonine-protein kinase RsbW
LHQVAEHSGRWMTSPTKRVEVTLETQLESVDLGENITVRVAEAAGFGEEDRYRIGIAVREGLINAVVYGNLEQRAKKIYLTLDLEPARFVIHILDEGLGFDLSAVPDPTSEENLLKNSGRGILLMRAFMDEFDVVRGRTGGAEVIMSKRFPEPEAVGA